MVSHIAPQNNLGASFSTDGGHEGDHGPKENGFDYTVDLVKLIRSEFGDHFTLGVVGRCDDNRPF